ncbi:MAG: type II toxin-antitoxin system VapC family toxin [Pleurocapsa sp.]
MTIWVLDTDHISLFQRGYPLVVERVNSVSAKNLAVTIVTVEEQMYGRLNQIKRAKNTDNLMEAYSKLKVTVNYFSSIEVLDFNEAAYSYYKQLLNQKIRIGAQDMKIAAIALSINAIVVTRNKRDFAKIPNLIWEDWSIIQENI